MRALDRKVLRDLRTIWAQALAIALVLACGVMVLVLSTGTQRSLTETRDAYYERHRFADVFASATRAPLGLLPRIAAIDGVAQVEARIVFTAMLDLEGMAEPASARVISLPALGEPALNLPLLRSGRLPDPLQPDEVALSEPFAQANGLQPGDMFRAVLNGRLRTLVVTGHLLSPEYIYTIGPGAMMPDDTHFGLIWMREPAAAAASDLDGAFNDLTLSLSRGAHTESVIAELDRILSPYGGTGAHGRDRQMSHVFIEGELTQLGAMARVLPPVFLIVSAFLVNMVLGRLIALERQQIGLFKAIGYATAEIVLHYLKMTIGIGVLGVLIGWSMGWWLGHAMTTLYTEYFRFPWLDYRPGAAPLVVSGLLALAAVVIGAVRAVAAAVRLAPAVAMSPPAPPVFRRGWVGDLGAALALRQTTMMILRSLSRWPGRAAVTLFGVAGSVAVLVASFVTFDIIDVVMEDIFDKANRQDATLLLHRAVGERAELDALSLPGVLLAEGVYAAPIRLGHGSRSKLVSLMARDPAARLTRVLDDDGRPIPLPDSGVTLPEALADNLGLRLGDRVRIELLAPPRAPWDVTVTGIIRQSMGQDVQMNRSELFALMNEAPQVNMLNLAIDMASLSALQAQIKETPAAAGFTLWADVRGAMEATMNESLITMTLIFSALGMLITIGVVYNAARIQLAERAHELASLRVLGFRRAEVGYVLVAEQMLLTVVAVPVGWVAGYGFARLMTQGFSTDIISLPLVISQATYAQSALTVLAAALVSVLLVRRRLDRIDIVTALKQKE